MKKFNMLLSAMLALAIFVGCGSGTSSVAPDAAEEPAAEQTAEPAEEAAEDDAGEEAGEAAADGDLYIPVISKGFSQQFWQTVKVGCDEAAADYGVTIEFVGPESETMIDKQVEMFETALNKNPAAICLAALDTKALDHLLQRADEMGIPIIGFDSGVDSDIPLTTAATDNYAAAAILAEEMGERLSGSGQVAVIVTDQVGASSVNRRDGFVETLAEKYPDIEVVDVLYGESDPLKSTDLSKATMQAYPELAGFVGLNEGSVIGILNAVEELNKDDLVILGFDSGLQQAEAVRSGVMAGAITQNPIGMGYITVESAIKAINGETLDPSIDTGCYFYTAENMDSDEIAPLLYE